MATRSYIAVKNADGTFLSIYCHWDGYPRGVGQDLLNEHNSEQAARALMEHGNLSTLSPLESYRSLGEKNQNAQTHDSLEDLCSTALDCGVDWIYLWTTEWMCGRNDAYDDEWKRLEDVNKEI